MADSNGHLGSGSISGKHSYTGSGSEKHPLTGSGSGSGSRSGSRSRKHSLARSGSHNLSLSASGKRYGTVGNETRTSIDILDRINDEEHNTKDIQEDHVHFQSKIGLILSCLGCVVGTGNIWRFPRIVAQNSYDEGGLVFLIVWVLFLLLWSIPMLTIEYGTGRYTQKAVVASFRQLLGDRAMWMGAWVCMVSFMISCYYAVVLGWCFYYFVYCIANELPETHDEGIQIFKDFAEDSYWPLLTTGLGIAFAALSVIKGVKTIEKVSMVLVPILLLILLFTFVWSLTRPYASVGITYLFTPNWESFSNPRLWVDALSQNAFDTGAGAGLMIPYSSYMTRKHGVVKYSSLIPTANNVVSLLSGITIFSAVFSTLIATRPYITQAEIVDVLKDSGPGSTGLTFIWLPVLFQTVGAFGRALACLFFLCLSFAGLTSLISNMELFAHTIADFGVKRVIVVPVCAVLTFGIGLMSALNINILTNQDFVWGFGLVLNGLMLIFMVVSVGTGHFREEMVNNFGLDDSKLAKTWEWVIKYIAPVEGIALIVWWAVDLIGDDNSEGLAWYEFGRETFMSTIVQWIGLMLILVLINMIFVYCCLRRRSGDIDRESLIDSATVDRTPVRQTTEIKL